MTQSAADESLRIRVVIAFGTSPMPDSTLGLVSRRNVFYRFLSISIPISFLFLFYFLGRAKLSWADKSTGSKL